MKRTPTATYRLQFNGDFTFDDATAIVPYLHELGVSHVYASPCLKARAGSRHGYDIVDHDALNPELGDERGFERLVAALHRCGMGLILDIVPNHMGVGGSDNSWWLDVLEHGEASAYAAWFDIDWRPSNSALRNKLLLPFLADHYGKVLERGELQLVFDAANGAFWVSCFDHRFPIDPRTYPRILSYRREALQSQKRINEVVSGQLDAVIDACRVLPRRTVSSLSGRRLRRKGAADCKRRLAELCRVDTELAKWLRDNVKQINGRAGQPASFDLLHRLLERQAYRLSYWKVAADEINYRRFFDINELAGLRMDNPEVFRATHRRIADMVAKGQIDGVRVDHVDGLSEPAGYCRTLRQLLRSQRQAGGPNPLAEGDGEPWIVVEKILASYERLPSTWPVNGTTGYEFAALLNGLFIHAGAEQPLTKFYHRFTRVDAWSRAGESGANFNEQLYESKKFVMHQPLSSELTVLANLLGSVARADRHTRDFTYQGLRDALSEVIACFPVYRTYIASNNIATHNNIASDSIASDSVSAEDRQYVEWAIAQASKRSPGDKLIFNFIGDILLLRKLEARMRHIQRRIIAFVLRFQQYTAAVTAKGMEDTACYRYYRLVSLNDVGFDPRNFGVAPATFHRENQRRLEAWPSAMVATSSHDSKRGEDVRARIAVLSEMPAEWRRCVRRWGRINKVRKQLIEEHWAPSRNDEYLLYQTLIGVWPDEPLSVADMDNLRVRTTAYMVKAAREAKRHTSWIDPDKDYEQALLDFVQALLNTDGNRFLAEFELFHRRVSRFGSFNGLSQTLLKLTVPGVPDIYQGTELWAYHLVDPDNRRPVDYGQRWEALRALTEAAKQQREPGALARELTNRVADGRAKLYLTWRALNLRWRFISLFERGDYIVLEASGERADHICAFARRLDDTEIIVAAPRWFALLNADDNGPPLGKRIWKDSRITLPAIMTASTYRSVLTDDVITVARHNDHRAIRAADLFASFPVALLINADREG